MTSYSPLTAAHEPTGHVVRWANGEHLDTTTIRWENEGFTVGGVLTGQRIEYVLRLSPTWQVRQFILFRDLEQPDLWLATDGAGRWGEMNGAHRPEFDGCYDLHVRGAAFTPSLPIRRLPLLEGHAAEVPVVVVDAETLETWVEVLRYSRLGSHRWRIERDEPDADDGLDAELQVEVTVDDHGLVKDYPFGAGRVS